MSDLARSRTIINSIKNPPKGAAGALPLVADYTWYSLEDLTRKHREDIDFVTNRSAEFAYAEGINLGVNVLKAQDAQYVPQRGEKLEEYLALKEGDYVTWYDIITVDSIPVARYGKIKSFDSFGGVYLSMRVKLPNGNLGHYVSAKAPLKRLKKI